MSDEIDDALRENAVRAQCQAVIDKQQRDEQAAEVSQWLTTLLRWSLLGYAAWLWCGWRGMVAALAALALAERAVVWAGWLIHTGKQR